MLTVGSRPCQVAVPALASPVLAEHAELSWL
jgi:hypothetical protein